MNSKTANKIANVYTFGILPVSLILAMIIIGNLNPVEPAIWFASCMIIGVGITMGLIGYIDHLRQKEFDNDFIIIKDPTGYPINTDDGIILGRIEERN